MTNRNNRIWRVLHHKLGVIVADLLYMTNLPLLRHWWPSLASQPTNHQHLPAMGSLPISHAWYRCARALAPTHRAHHLVCSKLHYLLNRAWILINQIICHLIKTNLIEVCVRVCGSFPARLIDRKRKTWHWQPNERHDRMIIVTRERERKRERCLAHRYRQNGNDAMIAHNPSCWWQTIIKWEKVSTGAAHTHTQNECRTRGWKSYPKSVISCRGEREIRRIVSTVPQWNSTLDASWRTTAFHPLWIQWIREGDD